MLRQLTGGLMAVIALGCAVIVGSSVAWSNIAGPVGAAHMRLVNFDQTFADAASAPCPANTPANRERLRDIGWSHMNVRLASR
jgi:hypothetical protein